MTEASAQSAEQIMQGAAGEKAGTIGKGELFVTALKREKIESTSANQALKSIGKLCDFHHLRTGDKYVYRVGANRKLIMLRYQQQRGQVIYEAVWDPGLGDYTSRVIEPGEIIMPAIPDNADEEGEVDVEHAAMKAQIENAPAEAPKENLDSAAPPESAAAERPIETAEDALAALETAKQGDPILQEDEALAGRPSPDDENPMGRIGGENAEPDIDDDYADIDDEQLNAPVIPSRAHDDPPPNVLEPESDYQNEPYPIPQPQIKAKKSSDSEMASFSMISLVMFVTGLALFLFAIFTIIYPRIQARHRIGQAGLHVRHMLRLGPNQHLACVENENRAYLIAINPDTMSFIAPCPPDEDKFWKRLEAKTYWYQMAQKPLSDRQLAALIKEFDKIDVKPQSRLMTADEFEAFEQDDSTAILVTSLDDEHQNNKSELSDSI